MARPTLKSGLPRTYQERLRVGWRPGECSSAMLSCTLSCSVLPATTHAKYPLSFPLPFPFGSSLTWLLGFSPAPGCLHLPFLSTYTPHSPKESRRSWYSDKHTFLGGVFFFGFCGILLTPHRWECLDAGDGASVPVPIPAKLNVSPSFHCCFCLSELRRRVLLYSSSLLYAHRRSWIWSSSLFNLIVALISWSYSHPSHPHNSLVWLDVSIPFPSHRRLHAWLHAIVVVTFYMFFHIPCRRRRLDSNLHHSPPIRHYSHSFTWPSSFMKHSEIVHHVFASLLFWYSLLDPSFPCINTSHPSFDVLDTIASRPCTSFRTTTFDVLHYPQLPAPSQHSALHHTIWHNRFFEAIHNIPPHNSPCHNTCVFRRSHNLPHHNTSRQHTFLLDR